MDIVFLKVFNLSITAGWLIGAVIVLRLLMKKAPKWLNCILWAMVAVRLLCPFSLESTFSLIPETETINPEILQSGAHPRIGHDIPALNNLLNSRISKSDTLIPGVSDKLVHNLMYIAGVVWAIGAVVLLGYAFMVYCRLYGKVREAIPLRDNIWVCDRVKSPFILGVFRPKVYLSSSISEEQGKYVLAHEQAHLKRRDHWWKLLGYFLLAVYWFHPLIWGAYYLFCRDVELACDEKTVRHMDIKEKKAYAEALVACSMPKRMILTSPLAFGEVGVKERVKKIVHYKKPAFWMSVTAIVVCVAVAVCFLTNPKDDTFHIGIVIPAGAEKGFYYSDEEISPNGNRVILWLEEGMGDTEVDLYPTGVNQNDTYAPAYITPGMPVKMEAEKGAWFQVGVNMSNPTQEDKTVYVRVKGVTVRIADSAAGADNHAAGSGTEAESYSESGREPEKSDLDMDKTSLEDSDDS